MKKNFLYISLLASSLLAISACSNDDASDIPVDQKTPIQLSVGEISGTATSRAITVAPTSPLTSAAFAEATNLYLVMKSEYGTDTKWTMTQGSVAANVSEVTFGAGFIRYWDDCYSRDAKLSVYGICTPGATPEKTTIGGKNTYSHTGTTTTDAWGGNYQPTSLTVADWSVSSEQTASTLKSEDLCYSNNISSATGCTRMSFNTETKHFTDGNMYFYHALSKITFKIEMGEGFSTNEFTFASGTNVSIKNVNVKNSSFDISNGTFSSAMNAYTPGDITKMYQSSYADNIYTLEALVLPETDLNESTTKDAISFTINNNKYELTKAALLNVILEADKANKMVDGSKLKQGVNYIFKLRVGKTKIEHIKAYLVDWETVEAQKTVTNARIKVENSSLTSALTEGFDLYRTRDAGNSDISDSYEGYQWNSDYGTKATLNINSDNQTFTAQSWFWDDNTTFYHFRATNATPSTGTNSTLSLTSGETYTDVKWGAPFKSGLSKFKYSTEYGFDGTYNGTDNSTHQIYKAIGATEDVISLILFHMMSELEITVSTTTGDDKVELTKQVGKETQYSTVELRGISTTGTVSMGNGKVTPSTEKGNHTITMTSTANKWTYGIVPQDLTGVQLVITTPDKNEYIVDMKDIIATSITTANIPNPYTDSKIDYWYPCYKYIYSFTLKKTGIKNITAYIVDWETVTATNQEVTIK